MRLRRGTPGSARAALASLASLQWAALPIRDRRWTAPLSAAAIGMGVFVGVAVGPNVEGTLGTSTPSEALVEAPPLTPPGGTSDGGDGGKADGGGSANSVGAGSGGSGVPDLDTSIPSSPGTPAFPSVSSTPTTPYAPPAVTPSAPATEPEETEPEPLVLTGTVVHLNPLARSFTMATEDGTLRAVHTHKMPAAGTSLETEVRTLANGTYAEDGERVEGGRRARAELSGIVTWRDPGSGDYTVSATGSSILIDARTRAAGPAAPPPVGSSVTVDARISPAALLVGEASAAAPPAEPPITDPPATGEEVIGGRTPNTSGRTPPAVPAARPDEPPPQGCGTGPKPPPAPLSTLTESSVEVDAEDLESADFAGIVQGVCRSSRRLVLSADDVDRAGSDLIFHATREIRLGPLRSGQVLDLGATIAADGRLEIIDLADDEGAKHADDPDRLQ